MPQFEAFVGELPAQCDLPKGATFRRPLGCAFRDSTILPTFHWSGVDSVVIAFPKIPLDCTESASLKCGRPNSISALQAVPPLGSTAWLSAAGGLSDAPAITLSRRPCCRRDFCWSQVICIRRSRIHFLPCLHRLMRLPRTRGARRAASVIVPVCGRKLSSNCCVARDILAQKLTQKRVISTPFPTSDIG